MTRATAERDAFSCQKTAPPDKRELTAGCLNLPKVHCQMCEETGERPWEPHQTSQNDAHGSNGQLDNQERRLTRCGDDGQQQHWQGPAILPGAIHLGHRGERDSAGVPEGACKGHAMRSSSK